ncbi:hypothetical protein T484DRAFT_1816610 [Baffinella frigidus]|nr:hypothetical protein T484DRAFT_1816610 [Cryptophyta sp. CCMP2293]
MFPSGNIAAIAAAPFSPAIEGTYERIEAPQKRRLVLTEHQREALREHQAEAPVGGLSYTGLEDAESRLAFSGLLDSSTRSDSRTQWSRAAQAGLSAPGASAHKDPKPDAPADAPVQTPDTTADATVQKTDASASPPKDGAGPEFPAGSEAGPGAATPQTASKRKAAEEAAALASPKKVARVGGAEAEERLAKLRDLSEQPGFEV